MPTYAALLYYTEDYDWTSPELADWMKEYDVFGVEAGDVVTGGAALQPTTTATTIHVQGGKGGDVIASDGPYAEAKDYRFNPFDLTKIWSKKDYPLIKVGKFTLNENPSNHFAQIEQAAFSPSNTVPGTGLSPDKMLLGRVFSYPDAQRNRIGTNFNQLPVNAPVTKTNSYDKEGQMQYHHSGNAPVYAPNSYGRSYQDEQGPVDNGWEADGELVRAAYTLHAEDSDFIQPGILVREVFDDAQRDQFVATVAGSLSTVEEPVLSKALQYWKNVDSTIGERIELASHVSRRGELEARERRIDAREQRRRRRCACRRCSVSTRSDSSQAGEAGRLPWQPLEAERAVEAGRGVEVARRKVRCGVVDHGPRLVR